MFQIKKNVYIKAEQYLPTMKKMVLIYRYAIHREISLYES